MKEKHVLSSLLEGKVLLRAFKEIDMYIILGDIGAE